MHSLAYWPHQRWPWLVLFATALGLLITALYMQHVQGLQPCVQCVYQRIAVLGIAVFAAVGALQPKRTLNRVVGLFGWLGSAAIGLYIANYHVWLQTAANPLFASCSPYPDFPSWMPLHEWIPFFFAAGGLCTDFSWQLLGMVMSEWMRIIFAVYLLAAVIVICARLLKQRKI
ncbi:MAG: disulfide bond formation protein DsbB [Idiomarinaceae bacterium HL-53]|nr:MAG: disulfide bond formation protein DsbB [Idiomarinaceae bacterium HL-53]CUS48597.1 disulfide bond formation protein DsbB [Idiomarinaceae bacterium HL-53]